MVSRSPAKSTGMQVLGRGIELPPVRQGKHMATTTRGIANPAQLSILTKALDDHCTKHGIGAGTEREDIASRLLALFADGVGEPEDLDAGLARMLRRRA